MEENAPIEVTSVSKEVRYSERLKNNVTINYDENDDKGNKDEINSIYTNTILTINPEYQIKHPTDKTANKNIYIADSVIAGKSELGGFAKKKIKQHDLVGNYFISL